MRGILLAGLIVAVVLILIRTIMVTPLIKNVSEGFANATGGKNLTNTATECPKGTTMYMYEGAAYCCSGTVDPDSNTVQKSCTAANSWQRGSSKLTFCTLGPATTDIKNCLELRAGLMQAEGERMCPPSKPNYVKEGDRARCCASSANDTYTDCVDLSTGTYCDFTSDSNELKDPQSCQFLKSKETAVTCPAKYKPFTTEGQGSMVDLTLYGCTDMGKNCYPSSLLTRLRQLGYKTDGLTPCS